MLKFLIFAIFGLSLQIVTRAQQNESFIHNCAQVEKSGIYHLKTNVGAKTHEFDVFCDDETLNGGWTVILLRNKGKLETFDRTQEQFKHGFGRLDKEFFLGLEKLHVLTTSRSHSLIFIMRESNGNSYTTYVPEFQVGGDPFYGYEELYNYEGTEIGMPLFAWEFNAGWPFAAKNSPKTKNRLNLFGPYHKILTNATELTMGFYNEETKTSIPLESIKMMIRPVNLYRSSFNETFARQFYANNEELRQQTILRT